MSSYAQFYAVARTAHVERAIENQTQLFYVRESYDFDARLANSTPLVRKTSVRRLSRDLARSGVETLEINEPLMLPSWRYTLPALIWLGTAVRRKKLRIVTYAIENHNPVHRFASVTRLPAPLASQLVGCVSTWIHSHLDLIVFGTEGSEALYRSLIRSPGPRPDSLLIPALPKAQALEGDCKVENSFAFLGDLSVRKGFDLLSEAWPLFAAASPEATLTVMGKGTLEERARELARGTHGVEFIHDPSRAQIRDVLTRSQYAILPSVTSSDWREQVGLPIVEAWSYGCRVLTSDATGIRKALSDAGHVVHREPLSVGSVVSMLKAAGEGSPSFEDLQGVLPEEDGRTTAWRAMRGVVQ